MKKYNYFYLTIFSIIFSSCGSLQKEDYKAVILSSKNILSPFENKKEDTIYLNKTTFLISPSYFKAYKMQKEIIEQKKLKPSISFFEWVDPKYAWILSNEEVDSIITSLSIQKMHSINETKINKISKESIFKIVMKEYNNSSKFMYTVSNPIYNKTKDVFIIQYKIPTLDFSTTTFIYKKENNKWLKIGKMIESSQ